jgi:uncharacterized protein YukE
MAGFGELSINYTELENLAHQLGNAGNMLEAQFNQLKGQMQSLQNDGWSSEAGNLLQNRFNALVNKFQNNYLVAIDNYKTVLIAVAHRYRDAEAAQLQGVQNLNNLGLQ